MQTATTQTINAFFQAKKLNVSLYISVFKEGSAFGRTQANIVFQILNLVIIINTLPIYSEKARQGKCAHSEAVSCEGVLRDRNDRYYGLKFFQQSLNLS